MEIMILKNRFSVLSGMETDDPYLIAAALSLKSVENKSVTVTAKPGCRDGGRERDGGGYSSDSSSNGSYFSDNNGFSDMNNELAENKESRKPNEKRDHGSMKSSGFRGRRHGGFDDEDVVEAERNRRPCGTGIGNGIKREGAGRRNWGTINDNIAPVTEEPTNKNDNVVEAEKQVVDGVTEDSNKDTHVTETEEKKPEDKEMTLEEYEKVLEEKRKTLLALKAEERKVVVDKEFQKMQLLSNKKNDKEIFAQGSGKDKRKETAEKEEKVKKQPVSTNEFFEPAERNGGMECRQGGMAFVVAR